MNYKTILEGVAVIILAALLFGSFKLYGSVEQNSRHRVEMKPKIDQMHNNIVEMRNDMKWLMKRMEK